MYQFFLIIVILLITVKTISSFKKQKIFALNNFYSVIMGALKDDNEWLFMLEDLKSNLSSIEIQWTVQKAGIIQELCLMGVTPHGFRAMPQKELQDYIDSLSD